MNVNPQLDEHLMSPSKRVAGDLASLDLPTLEEVSETRSKIHDRLLSAIQQIETDIITGRDEGWAPDPSQPNEKKKAPIYLTKGRVKDAESLFLKTKRRLGRRINQFTDIAGIRVLVLFEQHLLEVLEFLLREIAKPGDLQELEIYGMEETFMDDLKRSPAFTAHTAKGFVADSIKDDALNPEYRSIHLLFWRQVSPVGDFYTGFNGVGSHPQRGEFIFELQLRCLLDDVWSEMEHRLAYKQGMSNPQIATSFKLLKSDLTTMGQRLTNIQNLRNRHLALNQLAINKSEPWGYFHYEDEWNPASLLLPGERELFDKYAGEKGLVKQHEKKEITISELAKQSLPLIEQVKNILYTRARNDTDRDKVIYWSRMEVAYIHFLQTDYGKARATYEDLIRSRHFTDRPVLPFRLGEVLFVSGNEEDLKESLAKFDLAIAMLARITESDDVPPATLALGTDICTKVAAVYEMLGSDEYLDFSMLLLEKAMELFKRIPEGDPHRGNPLAPSHNLAWIYLEKFRTAKPEEKHEWHKMCLENIVSALDKIESNRETPDRLSSNLCDTAGWFFFQTYCQHAMYAGTGHEILDSNMVDRHGSPDDWLKKAQDYCGFMWKGFNKNPFQAASAGRQRNRAEDIMLGAKGGCENVDRQRSRKKVRFAAHETLDQGGDGV